MYDLWTVFYLLNSLFSSQSQDTKEGKAKGRRGEWQNTGRVSYHSFMYPLPRVLSKQGNKTTNINAVYYKSSRA